MSKFPKLALDQLSTGGGWGLGPNFARLPNKEEQMKDNTKTIYSIQQGGDEHEHSSDASSSSGVVAQAPPAPSASASKTPARGGASDFAAMMQMRAAGMQQQHAPSPNQPVPAMNTAKSYPVDADDDDDNTFVDYGSNVGGAKPPVLIPQPQLQPQPTQTPMATRPPVAPPSLMSGALSNNRQQQQQQQQVGTSAPTRHDGPEPVFDNSGMWRPGVIVSSLLLPPDQPFRTMAMAEGHSLWVSMGNEPINMFDLSGCELNPQRNANVVDVTAMAVVKVTSTKTQPVAEKFKESRANQGIGGRGRGGTNGGIGGLAAASILAHQKQHKDPQLVESSSLWCGTEKGAIAFVDLLLCNEDGVINGAHSEAIHFMYSIPHSLTGGTCCRVWTCSARDRQLKVWDGATRRAIARKQLQAPVTDCVAIPAEVIPHVWTASGEASVRVWDYDGKERSHSRFPPNSNALRFKSEVRLMRYHHATQLMWVCCVNGIILVNPKTYEVLQSLPIIALALEFGFSNPHTVTIIGYSTLDTKARPSEAPPVILTVECPFSSGRLGNDASFTLTREMVTIGQRVMDMNAFATPLGSQTQWPGIRLFSCGPYAVIPHTASSDSSYISIFTTETCEPVRGWGGGLFGAAGAPSSSSVAASSGVMSGFPGAARGSIQGVAPSARGSIMGGMAGSSNRAPMGMPYGKGPTNASVFSKPPASTQSMIKPLVKAMDDGRDGASTENTVVVHNTRQGSVMGGSAPYFQPFQGGGGGVMHKAPSIASFNGSVVIHREAAEGSVQQQPQQQPQWASMLSGPSATTSGPTSPPQQVVTVGSDPTLNKTLNELTQGLKSLRNSDQLQKDFSELSSFAQAQRFGIVTMSGTAEAAEESEEALAMAQRIALPRLEVPEARMIGEVLTYLAVRVQLLERERSTLTAKCAALESNALVANATSLGGTVGADNKTVTLPTHLFNAYLTASATAFQSSHGVASTSTAGFGGGQLPPLPTSSDGIHSASSPTLSLGLQQNAYTKGNLGSARNASVSNSGAIVSIANPALPANINALQQLCQAQALHVQSLLKQNNSLLEKVRECEVGLTRLEAALSASAGAVMGSSRQVDSTASPFGSNLSVANTGLLLRPLVPHLKDVERDIKRMRDGGRKGGISSAFGHASNALVKLIWLAQKQAALVLEGQVPSSVQSGLPIVSVADEGNAHLQKRAALLQRYAASTKLQHVKLPPRKLAELLRVAAFPVIAGMAEAVSGLEVQRATALEALRLVYTQGTLQVIQPPKGSSNPPALTSKQFGEAILVSCDPTSLVSFSDVTFSFNMFRLCLQETLFVVLEGILQDYISWGEGGGLYTGGDAEEDSPSAETVENGTGMEAISPAALEYLEKAFGSLNAPLAPNPTGASSAQVPPSAANAVASVRLEIEKGNSYIIAIGVELEATAARYRADVPQRRRVTQLLERYLAKTQHLGGMVSPTSRASTMDVVAEHPSWAVGGLAGLFAEAATSSLFTSAATTSPTSGPQSDGPLSPSHSHSQPSAHHQLALLEAKISQWRLHGCFWWGAVLARLIGGSLATISALLVAEKAKGRANTASTRLAGEHVSYVLGQIQDWRAMVKSVQQDLLMPLQATIAALGGSSSSNAKPQVGEGSPKTLSTTKRDPTYSADKALAPSPATTHLLTLYLRYLCASTATSDAFASLPVPPLLCPLPGSFKGGDNGGGGGTAAKDDAVPMEDILGYAERLRALLAPPAASNQSSTAKSAAAQKFSPFAFGVKSEGASVVVSNAALQAADGDKVPAALVELFAMFDQMSADATEVAARLDLCYHLLAQFEGAMRPLLDRCKVDASGGNIELSTYMVSDAFIAPVLEPSQIDLLMRLP